MKKKGVTMLVVVVAISVMLILISAAAVVGRNSIVTANFEEYMATLNRVASNVNEYYLENGKLPVTQETIAPKSIGDNFLSAVSKHGDQNNRLFVLNSNVLQDSTIKLGKGSVADKDVFVVAENTQNIYYLKGFKNKGVTYFTM